MQSDNPCNPAFFSHIACVGPFAHNARMTDSRDAIYEKAWHGEKPYDEREQVRLIKACRLVEEHRRMLGAGGRYELLDIGCGVGPLRQWLGQEIRITGLELSEEAAAIARKNYDHCVCGDVEKPWPLPPASFDGAHAGAIMEHVIDWHAPLNHANTALKDGGLLVITTPNLRYWKELKRVLRGKQPHWLSEMGHVHGYTPSFLRRLVEIHGFEFVSLEADRVNLPLLPRGWQWPCRVFAGIGSVMILAARLARRTRVEDISRAHQFPGCKEVGLRAVEVAT